MIYSVIVPLKNEQESLIPLHKELSNVLNTNHLEYEIIFIDDGSVDNSYKVLEEIKEKDKKVKLIKLRANFGKSYALDQGFKEAKGQTIITLDADLQDDPNEIPKLINKLNEGYDFVNGWRKKRSDSLTKKLSSWLFNSGTSLISGVKLHDFNCGLKAFRKEVADELYLRGELHRFMPVLAAKNKFKVTEVIVNHRARKFGKSKFGKFGIGRSWRGILDLITAIFVTDYLGRPAHFFGAIGLTFFLIGFVLDAYVTYLKILTGTIQEKLPLLLAGILFILLGVQLLSTGLIAEMISHFNRSSKS